MGFVKCGTKISLSHIFRNTIFVFQRSFGKLPTYLNVMYLSIHALTGAVIGQNIDSPLWAFTLGFIFHFIMDIIPHGDGKLVLAYEKSGKKKAALFMIGADIILTVLMIFFFSSREIINLRVTGMSAAIIGSLLPDLLCAFYELLNLFPRFHKFHSFSHNFLMKRVTVNFLPGTVMQILLAIFLLEHLLR